ncbi:hypothetical protein [Candidatus Viridilinea mediisalina]|uniref:Uncharacterized protein n=1 Tax=Candidatus Viridilinea mediisalina TaxID=2024553 RepID=A0A2A6RGU3_9CHLR|nr:hypothetical protein [Candidatus Viridilinea mediisalina]PDW02287.1 hypothetical protein CJ255_14760 [Candidatus Viridilinea mediisalina]
MSAIDDPNEVVFVLDAEFAILRSSPICTYCRHYRPGDGRACTAFPDEDSIPLAIWQGEYDHRQSYPGDNGIQFEPENAHCAAEVATHFAAHVSA